MDFIIPTNVSIGRLLAYTWAAFAILWQFAIYLTHGTEGLHLGRMIYFSVKPLFFAALIAQGFVWPRIVVGVLGIFEGFAYVFLGFFSLDEPAGLVVTGGAVVYMILCIMILFSKSLDDAARWQGSGDRRRDVRRPITRSPKPRR